MLVVKDYSTGKREAHLFLSLMSSSSGWMLQNNMISNECTITRMMTRNLSHIYCICGDLFVHMHNLHLCGIFPISLQFNNLLSIRELSM